MRLPKHFRVWLADKKKRRDRTLAMTPIELAKALRAEIERARTRPCADCKNLYLKQHADFMTFDHLDPKKKKFDIGGIGFGKDGKFGRHLVSLERLRAEIAKCEVVCRTCHDRRERRRRKALEAQRERQAVALVFGRVGEAFAQAYELEIRPVKEAEKREAKRRRKAEAARIAYNRAFEESWVLGCRAQAEIVGYALVPFLGRVAVSATYLTSVACWIVRRKPHRRSS
ncbi:MAG TPA: hypothetical protein VFF73_26785 [Planctomycetota bacterium]|nr:hypothetical protein [Planctomycetota bacterium]